MSILMAGHEFVCRPSQFNLIFIIAVNINEVQSFPHFNVVDRLDE